MPRLAYFYCKLGQIEIYGVVFSTEAKYANESLEANQTETLHHVFTYPLIFSKQL